MFWAYGIHAPQTGTSAIAKQHLVTESSEHCSSDSQESQNDQEQVIHVMKKQAFSQLQVMHTKLLLKYSNLRATAQKKPARIPSRVMNQASINKFYSIDI